MTARQRTSRILRVCAAALAGFVSLAAAAQDDTKSSAAASREPAPEPSLALPAHVETHHTIQLGQKSLDYKAIAETIPLTNAKGEKTASVFTIAYIADPKPGQVRPVVFLFNGGPGAAAVFLHLGAVGPRIMASPSTGAVPNPPVQIIDNPSTWLAFADLVFVDPVGTGFSRSEGKDENPSKQFWNVRGDIESLDSVVRLWLTRHERWASPLYLAGESYGGFRVAAMAKSLERDEGITPNGLIMISPALDWSMLNPGPGDLMAAAVELPTYAASNAALNGDTKFDTALVEKFALSDFLTGYAALPGVPPPGDPFIAKVASFIGLPEDIVRRERGWVGKEVFAHELRRKQDQVLSYYDATITRAAPNNPWDQAAGDPILDNAIAAFTAAFNAYAPDGLGYKTQLQYRVLPMTIVHQWNFDGTRDGQDGLGFALSGLQTALLDHPATKVLIVNGRYDLVTPYFASRWLVNQLNIPEATRKAITVKVYEGGHMMYMRPESRAALAADAATLIAAP
ncbi:MAG TPA: septum formation initiator [Stellaceae bacterium]|nr:septum formation initiator [Stellaceae bacterium]